MLRGMFAFARGTPSPANCPAREIRSHAVSLSPLSGGTAGPVRRNACWTSSSGGSTPIDHRALQHYTVLQYVPEPETPQSWGVG